MNPVIPEGATVKIVHLRMFEGRHYPMTRRQAVDIEKIAAPPLPKGGVTLARIEFANGDVSRAVARCNPRDTYNKAIGRLIAVGRALKLAEEATT